MVEILTIGAIQVRFLCFPLLLLQRNFNRDDDDDDDDDDESVT